MLHSHFLCLLSLICQYRSKERHIYKVFLIRASRVWRIHNNEGIILVQVATQSFQIKVRTSDNKYDIHHHQFPMTTTYAFTNYQSQGQTIPYVIVDITTPPTRGLNFFNLYIALSKSSGHSSIQLLQDFDDELFQKCHNPALLQDDWLEKLDRITKSWWQKIRHDCDRMAN